MIGKKRMLTTALGLAAFAKSIGMDTVVRGDDELKGVNVVEEYEKIQQKKSGLSREQREIICYRYEKLRKEESKC